MTWRVMACHDMSRRVMIRFYAVGLLQPMTAPLTSTDQLHDKLEGIIENVRSNTGPQRDFWSFLGLKVEINWDLL